MLLTSTLYYDARPGYFIRSTRTVCRYRKCSFLTGLITSLTDLLQAYHQGRIGTTKIKSTGSPAPARIASLSEFFCFALAEIFFRPRREPVRRIRNDDFVGQNILKEIQWTLSGWWAPDSLTWTYSGSTPVLGLSSVHLMESLCNLTLQDALASELK